jgi:hypothetical protein
MKKVKNNTIIQAGNGKVFRRISDGFIAGNSIHLGKTFYMGGRKLDKPITELPEHYEEIDEVIIDEEHPVIAAVDEVIVEVPAEEEAETTEAENITEQPEDVQPEKKQPVIITAGDIIDYQKKVDMLISLLTPAQKKKLNIPE